MEVRWVVVSARLSQVEHNCDCHGMFEYEISLYVTILLAPNEMALCEILYLYIINNNKQRHSFILLINENF